MSDLQNVQHYFSTSYWLIWNIPCFVFYNLVITMSTSSLLSTYRTHIRQFSVLIRGLTLWNSLPTESTSLPTLHHLKKQLKRYFVKSLWWTVAYNSFVCMDYCTMHMTTCITLYVSVCMYFLPVLIHAFDDQRYCIWKWNWGSGDPASGTMLLLLDLPFDLWTM